MPSPAPACSTSPRLALLREQRYRRHFLREDGRPTAIVMGVYGVTFSAGIGNEFLFFRGSPLLGFTIASRLQVPVVAAIVVLLLRRAKWPRQQDRAFTLALVAQGVAVLGTHLTRLQSTQIQGPLVSTFMMLIGLYFAVRGPIVPRAILGGWISLVGLALLADPASAIERPARLTSALGVVAVNVVGIFSARFFEEQRRKRFEAERHERQARQELAVKLRELAAEKERAEAMSHARAAFLAAMSHEFRTPMNAVIGLSDLLLDEPMAPAHSAHIRTISDSARALLALLEEILDFAKIDAQKLALSPAPFGLRQLATSVITMLRPAAEKRSLELSVSIAPEVPEYVLGDDARLRQVLVNLVSNAVKFTERGSVRLRISARPPDDGGPEVLFRVEDTGTGMSPEVLGRLFRPFEQADAGITRRVGGTGLGLAISRRIVVAMGGDIAVESEPGRGSVFAFTLRLPPSAPPPEVPSVPRPAERPPLAILVVDDHPINREVARAKLGRLGYEIDLASDGQEAVEAAAKQHYDVVFMDLQMPGMSGIEATRRMGELAGDRRAPYIVALTAAVFEEDREACRRAGMRDFVGKPIDLAQLDAVLRRVAEERGAALPPPVRAPLDAPPQIERPAPEILARETLATLRHIESLGEPRFVERLFRIFLADAPERLHRMRAALEPLDAATVTREAHALTATSATLGATALSEACALVESAARDLRPDALRKGLHAVATHLVEVERALSREVEPGPRGAATAQEAS